MVPALPCDGSVVLRCRGAVCLRWLAALLASAHAGTDLPLDRLELPPSRLREGSAPPQLASPPPFLVHLPTEDEANAPTVGALLNMAVAGDLSAHYGDVLMRQLELCRVQLLLRFVLLQVGDVVDGPPLWGVLVVHSLF